MKLIVLGMLHERDMHPYEISLVMKDRNMTHYTKLQIGSLYYAIDQMAKDGEIEVVEVIRSKNRPDKTVYRITDQGRAMFQQLLLGKFKEIEPIYHPMYGALSFAKYGDAEELAAILEQRIYEMRHQVNFYYTLYEDHRGTVPLGGLHLMIGLYEHAKTELNWLQRLHADVKNNRLGELGSLDLGEEE
ncbi:PadR family transcriptional regulator [Paenibacillus beijingensis]|uniref:PadR family transcriptional regulator n=2 Tax=Paenibacillus beijingensis TaxID=1126833 RepID=A0A0D5NQL4_9BACL|nr:PadR family transcriptional regulator [Paenibacillus beijingensis]